VVSVDIDGESVARERLAVRIVYRSPAFGNARSVDSELIVEGGNTDVDVDLPIDNVGRGTMKLSNVEFSGVPDELDVSTEQLPDTVAPGDTATAEVEVTADSATPAGEQTFTATISDNAGNRLSIPVRVFVVKPAVADVSGDVDFGGVRLGDSETLSVEVEEVGGNVGIDGLDVRVTDDIDAGTVSVRDAGTFSTTAGGSDELEFEVDISDDAPQGDIEWELELTPENARSPSTTVDVQAYVLYPPELGPIDTDGLTLTFDEPRARTDTFSARTSVAIPNEGDLDMSVESVSASTDTAGLSVRVVSVPSSVGGQTDEDADVEFTADSSLPEGEYEYTVDADAGRAGSDRTTGTVEIDHERRLDVDRSTVAFGDVRISSPRTQTVDVSEALGYERIDDLRMRLVDGPDRYLTVRQRPPSELEAGESSSVVFALSFPASAELYRTYTWVYELSGDGVDTRTVEVTARPEPVEFGEITSRLDDLSASGWRGTVTTGLSESLRTVEERLRNNESLPSEDLSRAVAAARSGVLVIESIESARDARGEANASAAQVAVVRAAAAHRALELYVESLATDEVRRPAERALEASRREIDTEIERQEAYYTPRLSSDNATALTRATAARRLARLRSLAGQPEAARRYENRSRAAFERYDRLVRDATGHIQAARAADRSINNSSAAVLYGRAIVINPLRISQIEDRVATVDEEYRTAAETFEQAGATHDAEAISRRRGAVSQRLQQTVVILYGWSGSLAVGFVVTVWWLIRQSVAYARDRDTASVTSAITRV
jgi:hypothetical protein